MSTRSLQFFVLSIPHKCIICLKEIKCACFGHFFCPISVRPWASLMFQAVKNLPVMQKTWVQSLGQEDPLEEGMATHPSILPWEIPQTEDPGELQSMGSQRVRHNWLPKTFHAYKLKFVYFFPVNLSCVHFLTSPATKAQEGPGKIFPFLTK